MRGLLRFLVHICFLNKITGFGCLVHYIMMTNNAMDLFVFFTCVIIESHDSCIVITCQMGFTLILIVNINIALSIILSQYITKFFTSILKNLVTCYCCLAETEECNLVESLSSVFYNLNAP